MTGPSVVRRRRAAISVAAVLLVVVAIIAALTLRPDSNEATGTSGTAAVPDVPNFSRPGPLRIVVGDGRASIAVTVEDHGVLHHHSASGAVKNTGDAPITILGWEPVRHERLRPGGLVIIQNYLGLHGSHGGVGLPPPQVLRQGMPYLDAANQPDIPPGSDDDEPYRLYFGFVLDAPDDWGFIDDARLRYRYRGTDHELLIPIAMTACIAEPCQHADERDGTPATSPART